VKKDETKASTGVAAPKPRRSTRRRLLRATGLVALALALLLAFHPIWQPWVMGPVLRQYGVAFSAYDRIGYSRFALLDGTFEKDGISFDFKRLEAPTAGALLWTRCFRNDASKTSRPTLNLADWRLEITPASSPDPSPEGLDSTAAVLDLISSQLPEARAWIPSIKTTNGIVRALDERIQIPSLDWNDGRLRIDARTDRFSGDMVCEIDATGDKKFAIKMEAPALGIRSSASLSKSDGNWPLTGTLEWRTNRVGFTALFTDDDWPPLTAEIAARELRIPGPLARLDGYREIKGAFNARWADARYELVADATATDESGLPPIVAGFSATGDLASVRITRAEASARGLRIAQAEPLEIRFADGLNMDAAELRIALDLDRASGALVTGEVTGNVRLLPRAGELPKIRATLASDTTAWRDWKLSSAALRCSLVWPELLVQEIAAQLEDGSRFTAEARLDLAHQRILSSRWSLSGNALNRLLPAGADTKSLEASGKIEGGFPSLAHTTQITIRELSLPGLAPADVEASWRGKGAEATIDRLEWRAANSAARISGRLTLLAADGPRGAKLALKTMALVKADQTLLQLESETQLQLLLDTTRGGWSVRSGDLRLAEGKRSFALDVALQSDGAQSIRAAAQALPLNDFSEFLARPIPGDITISRLAADASWSNGPIAFALEVEAATLAPDGKPITVKGKAQGAPAGVRIESLTLSGQSSEIIHTAGFAPLIVVPSAGKNALQFAPGQSFDLNVTVETNRVFWSRVAELTSVRIEEPDIRLHLGGMPESLNGTLRASFATAAWERKIGSLVPPRMEAIEIDAELNKGAARLKKAEFQIEGQTVRIDASLPIDTDFRLGLTKRPEPPNWRDGEARIRLSNAQVAPFQRYLPATLRPQGSMDANLKWRAGGGLDGFVKLRDAATLPLPAIGPVRDIAAHVEFGGREATLKSFSGALGDEPVFVAGRIALPQDGLPRFEFSLRGTNVSLVRQPGTIVRSDLDLLISLTNGTPLLSGTATLRDSAFLQDLRVLRGKVRQSERRYPFFQIDDPALSAWRLDLRVKGDQFLKTRTPWFRGVASADFHLGGTLGNPVAPGFVRVDSGVAQFPFGFLDVSSGRATVELAAPHQMKLNVAASGSAFDYSITMKVEGSLEEPRVIFSSSPPLNSQQILLMLTAGQIPRDDIHLTSQQKAARIAVYLGKDLLARLGAEPDQADRLTIRSGENVTDQGRLSYSLEYRLTDRWSAVGEYDRFSAVNAGLKWRIYSK
jgi:translocation and assembly module TamB